MKPKRNNTKWVRQTNEENINSLNCELNKLTWETVLNEEDVSKAYDTFISNFTYIFDKCCPMKEVNINKSRLEPKKPWLTTGLVNACHKKNNLYRLFLKDRTKYTENRYKAYKNKLITILRCEKKKHYCTLMLKQKTILLEHGKYSE
jgi:hypothetical protein